MCNYYMQLAGHKVNQLSIVKGHIVLSLCVSLPELYFHLI